jgi:hypothetical protein
LESLGVVQRWLHAHLHEFAKQVQDAWMLPSWSTYDLSTFPVHHSSLDVASWLARMEQSYPLAVPRPDSESFAWSELGA